jgi:hypothetical protein
VVCGRGKEEKGGRQGVRDLTISDEICRESDIWQGVRYLTISDEIYRESDI